MGSELMLILFFCLFLTSSTEARSFAVSNIACQNMTPIHGSIVPQTSIARIQIVPHAYKVKRGQMIKVSLHRVASDFTYRGFLVQARSVDSEKIVGNFMPNDDSKVMVCGDSYSTVSHSNPSAKTEQVLLWKAPSDFVGSVRFQATIVESFETFWTNLMSPDVKIT